MTALKSTRIYFLRMYLVAILKIMKHNPTPETKK